MKALVRQLIFSSTSPKEVDNTPERKANMTNFSIQVLAFCAATLALPASFGHAAEGSNALSANALSANALSANALTRNGVLWNGLRYNDSAFKGTLHYVKTVNGIHLNSRSIEVGKPLFFKFLGKRPLADTGRRSTTQIAQ